MSKYTPGPWMIGNIQGVDMVIENHDGFEVCTVWEDPEQHDARLISAAPDLLEALQGLLNAHEFNIAYWHKEEIAAITKATGETK